MKALITGAFGQDATLLAELLRRHGWSVTGTVRAGSVGPRSPHMEIIELDLGCHRDVLATICQLQPAHVYHLAACHQSSEGSADSKTEAEMIATNFRGAELILRAVVKAVPKCRVVLAGSSQMYTRPASGTLSVNEATETRPGTFYGQTKCWSWDLLQHFRARHGVFGVMGILFNHESYLRRPQFLSRKISLAAARAKLGMRERVEIRNVWACVDWSSAADVVAGLFAAAKAELPEDYVFGSGRLVSVKQLLEVAFESVGLDWRDFVEAGRGSVDGALVADPSKAHQSLGWWPAAPIENTIRQMVEFDVAQLNRGERAGS